jgi:hypothetical protein
MAGGSDHAGMTGSETISSQLNEAQSSTSDPDARLYRSEGCWCVVGQ